MLSAVQGVGHRNLAHSKECSDFLALFCMGLVIAVGIGGDRGRARTQERSLILPSRKPVIFIAYLRLEFFTHCKILAEHPRKASIFGIRPQCNSSRIRTP